jgi:site-specific DNA-cytosine methylase
MDRGLELAGLGPTLFQIEIEPFCRSVLEKHWPHADRSITDIRNATAAGLPRVDLLCGGSPCQNLSSAGDRSGLGGPKSRLWYEFARLIEEMRPTWVVFENVASGAARWVDAVRGRLAEFGYATLPIQVAASDLGAPHRRSRVFIVANFDGMRELQPQGSVSELRGWTGDGAAAPTATDVEGIGGASRRAGGTEESSGRAIAARDASTDAVSTGRPRTRETAFEGRVRSSEFSWWSPESGVLPTVHGLSGGLAGRRRRAAIRALGNSCTPPQAQVAGEVIRILLEAA